MEECPFKKVLIPLTQSEQSKRSIIFASKVFNEIKIPLEVTLLHVVCTESFISTHMKNIDLRTELLKESEIFQQLKKEYISDIIYPFLKNYAQLIKKFCPEIQIKIRIEEGEPGNKIVEIVKKENISTIVMARRGLSTFKGMLLGSVSHKVIHSLKYKNIYLVGEKVTEDTFLEIRKILIPVDGSIYSQKALEHALCLIKYLKNIEKISLIRVINVDLFEERKKQGINPKEEAEKVIEESKKKLKNVIPENIITTKIGIGIPGDEIVKEIEEGNYDLVIIGRKGRTSLEDIILGRVSIEVINRCLDVTIVLINL
ncbi:MAG: universal stress protein [Thermodesulfobacteriota bacterium]|nr:MAG: universal stress protein [Thermodesulfobacteriota bacterium]RLG13021.1 MAG: universal stress protein [Candidatus Pacearchaeota archaeon]